MRKYSINVVISMVFLLSGCSLFHFYDGKTPIEIEQHENPIIWREMLQVQNTLWPLEKNVNKVEKNVNAMQKNANEMRDELATTKLSSIQANKNIESLQAEVQQIKSELIRKEKTSAELQSENKNKKEILKKGTAKVAGERKKAGPDIRSFIINDIEYHNVSDTQDRVLIYVNAMNNPKLQTLSGENPRIVLDFFNARNMYKENEINTNGNFIRRVRIRSHKEPTQKIRVVFDMVPNKKYSVVQKFLKKENIYFFDLKAK
jgi:hypothetical protein